MSNSAGGIVVEFRRRLLDWGGKNAQKYPWRWTNDSYLVLVSEFMLHRTQVKQVIAVYHQFIAACPTLELFAKTDKDHLRKILASLGLSWRINGMINALNFFWNQYREIPVEQEKLMQVEGVGQYIAGATICFTNNEPIGLIDTNIVRVVGRVFGLDLSGEARRRKSVIEAVDSVCDPDNPRDYYYAMIDFAHYICTPRKPDCEDCPLLDLPCHHGNFSIKEKAQGDD